MILSPQIDRYLESLVPERDPVFHAMEQEAEQTGFPHVGPQVGALLELLTRSIGAKSVFELGSGFGYSAAWFLRGLPEGGTIILTDHSEENRKKAIKTLAQLGREDAFEFRVGDALEIVGQEKGTFDILFNDIDKKDYPSVIPHAEARLRSGGLLISDNALWYGKVAQEERDAATNAVREYNRLLAEHSGFDVVIVPLRDGVSVARKR